MKGGVLIIGSLFWDNHQNTYLNVRENWRINHLQFNNRIHVKVPIRYGRTSGEGEKKVYTMVFSHSLAEGNDWGTAFAVPFKLHIQNFQTLYQQVQYLSEAEGAKDMRVVKRDKEKTIWCIIGILFNPRFDAVQKKAILDAFRQKLDDEQMGDEYRRFCIAPERSILSAQGEILIPWLTATHPKSQPMVDHLDFIIATCPKQNIDAYPAPALIKAAALKDSRKYFYNNVACGITTFQDREVVEAQVKE